MADLKQKDVASAAMTITLASLATSSTLVAGRCAVEIVNNSNEYLDYLVAGKVTTGTSPTAGLIEVWAFGSWNDSKTYGDTLVGTDSGVTVTSRDILVSAARLIASMPTSSTSNITYPFGPVSIANLFGGNMPYSFGLFVVHNTAVNLNATGSNHAIYQTARYRTIL
jgi:hypothetical protein